MSDPNTLDARGEVCPIPVMKAKKAIDRAVAGDIIEVHVDNEIAVQNLTRMAKSQNCTSTCEQAEKKHFIVRIQVSGGEKAPEPFRHQTEKTAADSGNKENSGRIAVISSGLMGNGDEALGRILMKGFLYALSQLEELPSKILFYNSGVFLTTDDSESLDDLKHMEEQGTAIYSCGTCLDYYKRKEMLKVGSIANMYEIVEAMSQAEQILRP